MFEILLYVVLAIVVLLSIAIEIYKWLTNKKIGNFVSAFNYPVIGVGGFLIGRSKYDIFATVNEVFENQPDSVTAGYSWLGPQLVITLTDPDDLKTVLTSDNCLDKPYVYKFFNSNNSLLSAPKEQWKHDRRQLNPTLNNKIVAKYLPIFNAKAKVCTEIIANANGIVDFHRIFMKCLLDMNFATVFGCDRNLQEPHGDILYDSMMDVMAHNQTRVGQPWLAWNFVYRLTKSYEQQLKSYVNILRFINDVAVTKSAELNELLQQNAGKEDFEIENITSNLNFLEKCFLLLRKGKMTEETLNDHAYIVTVGAVDTSSATMLNLCLMLAMHPEAQEKVVNELREIFDTVDRPATAEDCSRMVYTEMVIKETLRLFPSVPMLGRSCTADIPIRLGTIPKGSIILFNLLKIHKQKRNWGPRSNEFYPEHFSPENMVDMHPYKYLAFSGGNRNCIGLKYAYSSTKVMTAHLLRRFKFTTDLKFDDVEIEWNVVMKIKNKNPFRCEPRVFK